MSTVEIKSNVIGDLKTIRDGVVYKDEATPLMEVIQNSQRAGATKIDVNIESITDSVKKLIIQDNGEGCDDPQLVFEKHRTGWKNDIIQNEAFGQGFFSLFYLGDEFTVRSKDWKVTVNVNEIIETGKLELNVEKAEVIEGFRVEVNVDSDRHSIYTLSEELKRFGRYVENIEVFYNNRKVEKESFTDTSTFKYSEYYKEVDNDLYSGVLVPKEILNDLEVYFNNRFVKKIYRTVSGRINLKTDAVNLKAPDRRDIVNNDKYQEFLEQLDKDAKEMYLEMFDKNPSEKMLNDVAREVDKLLSVEDYMNKIMISRIVSDINELEGRPEGKIDKEAAKVLEEVIDNLDSKERDGEKIPLVDYIEGKEDKVTWVSATDINSHLDKIRKCEYFGIEVIIAENNLFDNVLEEKGIPYISHINIEEEHATKNEGPKNKKEERLIHLLDELVNRLYCSDKGNREKIFKIAEITLKAKYNGIERQLDEEGDLKGYYDPGEYKIYLNRNSYNLKPVNMNLESTVENKIVKNDLKLLMTVLPTVSHELAHMLYKTKDNTQEHTVYETEIYEELVNEIINK